MRLHVPTPGDSITEHLLRAREHRDPRALLMAGYRVVREGRAAELFYGLYCEAIGRPAQVRRDAGIEILRMLSRFEHALASGGALLTRAQVVKAYENRYALAKLPADFQTLRAQTIAEVDGCLVVGEYGRDSARLAIVSAESCEVFTPYARTPGVRHIHLVLPTSVPGEFFMTTGDATKVLDLFSIASGRPRLIARHRARFAGYTGAARVRDRIFFGTDFSSRPNYIETLSGERYFLPPPAYRQWVRCVTAMDDDHLAVVTDDIAANLRGGESRTVAVFDARNNQFVFCEAWPRVFGATPPSTGR